MSQLLQVLEERYLENLLNLFNILFFKILLSGGAGGAVRRGLAASQTVIIADGALVIARVRVVSVRTDLGTDRRGGTEVSRISAARAVGDGAVSAGCAEDIAVLAAVIEAAAPLAGRTGARAGRAVEEESCCAGLALCG